jgi:biotin carboxyl carrier protein
VPDAHPSADRSPTERAADHAAIDRLAEGLLPALIAKLGATGLGELEVREGRWRVRLRRPADDRPTPTGSSSGRRRERGDRHDGGSDRADGTRDRTSRSSGSGDGATAGRDGSRQAATSPAVGIYRPRADLAAGSRVRAGDRLGSVDMLGVAQEVVAPADGIIGASLAESGDAVEYGQSLLVIEFSPGASSGNGTGA